MQKSFSRSKCFPLIRLDLALHIVPRIRYIGSRLREEGSLDYNGGLVRLQVQTNFDTTINRQQAHSGREAGPSLMTVFADLK
jgi:hypothetical protein